MLYNVIYDNNNIGRSRLQLVIIDIYLDILKYYVLQYEALNKT